MGGVGEGGVGWREFEGHISSLGSRSQQHRIAEDTAMDGSIKDGKERTGSK